MLSLRRLQFRSAVRAARGFDGNVGYAVGALFRGWRNGLFGLQLLQAIRRTNNQKDYKRHNEKVDYCVDKHAVIEGRCAGGLRLS